MNLNSDSRYTSSSSSERCSDVQGSSYCTASTAQGFSQNICCYPGVPSMCGTMTEPSSMASATSFPQRSSPCSNRFAIHSAAPAVERRSSEAQRSPAWKAAAHAAVLDAAAATVATAATSASTASCAAAATLCEAAAAAPHAANAHLGVSAGPVAVKQRLSPGAAYFSDACYRRLLLSFSSSKWFCPPAELSPFLLARNGFRCTDTGTIECAVCGEKWTAKRGRHAEIAPTPARAAHTNACAAGDAALSPPAADTRLSAPAAAATEETAAEFLVSPAAAADGGGATGAGEHAASAAGTAAPTAGAALPIGAAAAAGGLEAAAAAARSLGDDVWEGAAARKEQKRKPQQQQRQAVTSEAPASCPEANPDGSRRHGAPAHLPGSSFRPEKGEKMEREGEKAQNSVCMDAVALSFLHAPCCPWRNYFIPLASIRLDGAALYPAALVSQWTDRGTARAGGFEYLVLTLSVDNKVQQLRRAAAAAGSPSQTAPYPCLTVHSARFFLLSALIAAAEAAAEVHARTAAVVRTPAAGTAPAAQQAADLRAGAQGGALSKQAADAAGVQEESIAGEVLSERSPCSHPSGYSKFLSSPQSPLKAACVGQLSKREVHLLQQLWLFISGGDKERETLLRKHITPGAVIPPMCASTLLLESKCALQEGPERYKEADEYLSLPLLKTLLRQVVALLFDARVPLPGSQVTGETPPGDEDSSAIFSFPKEHEAVHIDYDKVLAFFGWEPVTGCTKSEPQRRRTAAESGRKRQRQKSDTAESDSDQPRLAHQQSKEHEFQGPEALQRAGVSAEQKQRESDQQQQNQSVGPTKVKAGSRCEVEENLAGATVRDVTAEEQRFTPMLQCLYCFRRVYLRNSLFSAENGHISSDCTRDSSSSYTVDTSRKSGKMGVENNVVQGWRRRTQIGDKEKIQPAGLWKGSPGSETVGGRNTTARNKDNAKNAALESEGDNFPKNVLSSAGGSAAVSCGEDSRVDRNNFAAGGPYVSIDVDADEEERPDILANGSNMGERKRDTFVGGVQAQVADFPSTRRNNNRRYHEVDKTTLTCSAPCFDPVYTHRLHCPFMCNAVYKERLPVVLKLFLSLLPTLVHTLQLQLEKRSLDAEIEEMWSFRRRPLRSEQTGDDGEKTPL